MAGKARNRKPLEQALYLSIDCLHLVRMPAGWDRRGKATRSVRVQHRRRNQTVAETDLHAEIETSAGVALLKHRGVDGMVIEQSVRLEPVSQHFGGQRWFFICPITGARARKLHRQAGMRWFCSRQGLPEPVTYRSQRDSAAQRTMRQIWELRDRLGDRGWLLGALAKPEDMDDMEFCRYVFRYLELASRLDFSIHGLKVKRALLSEGRNTTQR
jgi:hypothetical protein